MLCLARLLEERLNATHLLSSIANMSHQLPSLRVNGRASADYATLAHADAHSFVQHAPHLLATACQKLSLPYSPPAKEEADQANAWLRVLQDAHHASASQLLDGCPRDAEVALTTAGGPELELIDVAVSDRLYALAITKPGKWETALPTHVVLSCDLPVAKKGMIMRRIEGKGAEPSRTSAG